jgi:3-(3-hydroxy-phenyl)propionate hydroxylase
MSANLLGTYGLNVVVLEAGPQLIDFPRGVGIDDEALRTCQSAGIVAGVLPHTVPHQPLAFLDAKGRDLARLLPPTSEFGWPRRNGFVQPLVDRASYEGLSRFEHVEVRFSARVTGISQDATGVDVTYDGPDGSQTIRAQYVIGADGGSSATRGLLDIPFEGSTAAEHWYVIDIRNDPLGQPGAYVICDPKRPYVSISIPHGIRRFEFMLLPGETDEEAMSDEFVAKLLEPLVPNSAKVDIIRRRVYAHQSRIASNFRSGRVFLVGDAAHCMPVWQGQGFNSGIRDAFNLAWKIAAAVKGMANDRILDSYDSERRDHVKGMVALSRNVGRAVSVRNRVAAGARNVFFRSLSAIPKAKMYIVTMRFKPMPTMTEGALTFKGSASDPSPVGRIFPQPTVATADAPAVKLDDALGPWLSLVAWNNNPLAVLDDDAKRRLDRLGVRYIEARPSIQLGWSDGRQDDAVVLVGDTDNSLKKWFEARPDSVVLIRPDRIVAGASPAHAASDMVRSFDTAIGNV